MPTSKRQTRPPRPPRQTPATPDPKRKPRSDRKPANQSFTARKMVKFTPAGLSELERQAARADMESSRYLRWLLERDRRRLSLASFAFNEK